MNTTINEAGICGMLTSNKDTVVSDGMRLALNNVFNELPVAIFGLITAAYLASSLLALVR